MKPVIFYGNGVALSTLINNPNIYSENYIHNLYEYDLIHYESIDLNYPDGSTRFFANNWELTIWIRNKKLVGYWIVTTKINKLDFVDREYEREFISSINSFDLTCEKYIEAVFYYLNNKLDTKKTLKNVLSGVLLRSKNSEIISDYGSSVYIETNDITGHISYFQILFNNKMYKVDYDMKYTDKIAQTYYDRLDEALYLKGESTDNLRTKKEVRMRKYFTSMRDPVSLNLGDNVSLHKTASNTETAYTTLDHNKKEAIHFSIFNKHDAGNRLPFAHETQDSVERTDHPSLPKGYATDIAYTHFLQSKHPLSSSDEQYIGGNNMWKRLAHRAFDDGHHVYLWDNLSKTLSHLDSKEKINNGLDHYFGTKPRTMDFGHMVLSKEKLDI